jgi:hypothetical protein
LLPNSLSPREAEENDGSGANDVTVNAERCTRTRHLAFEGTNKKVASARHFVEMDNVVG